MPRPKCIHTVRPSSCRFRHDPRFPTSLGDDRVTALLHDSDGVLWAGTVAGGLNRFNPATGRFIRFQHDPDNPITLFNNKVESIFEDEPSSYVKSLSPDRFTETAWDWTTAGEQARRVYETYYAIGH